VVDRYFRSMFKSRTAGLLSPLTVIRGNDRYFLYLGLLIMHSADAKADVACGFAAEALF
jgi:hypothetical protein